MRVYLLVARFSPSTLLMSYRSQRLVSRTFSANGIDLKDSQTELTSESLISHKNEITSLSARLAEMQSKYAKEQKEKVETMKEVSGVITNACHKSHVSG